MYQRVIRHGRPWLIRICILHPITAIVIAVATRDEFKRTWCSSIEMVVVSATMGSRARELSFWIRVVNEDDKFKDLGAFGESNAI
jgi:hypothetical protein